MDIQPKDTAVISEKHFLAGKHVTVLSVLDNEMADVLLDSGRKTIVQVKDLIPK